MPSNRKASGKRPSNEKYRKLRRLWHIMRNEVIDVCVRFEHNQIVQPPHGLMNELSDLLGSFEEITEELGQFSSHRRTAYSTECSHLKKNLREMLHTMEAFTEGAYIIHEKLVDDMEDNKLKAGPVKQLKVDYRELVKEFQEPVRKVIKPEGDVEARNALVDASGDGRKILKLLLSIYDGLVEYWQAWLMFFEVDDDRFNDDEDEDDFDESDIVDDRGRRYVGQP